MVDTDKVGSRIEECIRYTLENNYYVNHRDNLTFIKYGSAKLESLRSQFYSDVDIIEECREITYLTCNVAHSPIYYSQNRKFIIKVIKKKEQRFVFKQLNRMLEYMYENSNTLLSRIYGLYEVRVRNETPFVFIVEQNFLVQPGSEVYDLKGSRCNRARRGDELCLKDNDWKGKGQYIYGCRVNSLLEQLKKDIKFLVSLKVMDYSMIINVGCSFNNEKFGIDNVENIGAHLYLLRNDDRVAHEIISIGIIDFFSKYNFNKMIEKYMRRLFLCQRESSCLDPTSYQERFIRSITVSVLRTGCNSRCKAL